MFEIEFQGHRIVWWHSELDLDEGKAPTDQLLLFGHAGVTDASPLDIREIGDNSRLICVFGKDRHGLQSKITILCKDSVSCKLLSAVANNAILIQINIDHLTLFITFFELLTIPNHNQYFLIKNPSMMQISIYCRSTRDGLLLLVVYLLVQFRFGLL